MRNSKRIIYTPGTKYKMPRKQAPKRQYRKRRGYGKSKQRTTVVNRSVNPIPAKYITKMKYAFSATPTAVLGMQTVALNLNSIYDPERRIGGGQPWGYDQLLGTSAGTGLYNKYRVISCKYVVTALSVSSNIQFACLPSNNTTPPVDRVSEARMNPRCKFAMQNPGGTLKVLKGNVYVPSLMGRTKAQYMAEENMSGTWNSDPVEFATLHIYGQGINDDNSFDTQITFNVLLEYTVELFDPNSFNEST